MTKRGKNPLQCATRADVAKLAGVSVTVVSYVVNNNRYVEKSKRERVLKAMEELHYKPNSIARALKGKSSNHIVFIADRITNGNFGELISRMDSYAYEKDSLISLCTNRNSEEFVRQIISRHFDGIIISSLSFPEQYIQQLIDASVPVVILKNRDYDNITSAGIIDTGLEKGTRESVQYLYEKGHRRIIYIDRISSRNHFSTLEDFRLRGYVEQMKEYDLEPEVLTGCTTPEEVSEKIRARLQEDSVDAIFCRNDSMACVALQSVLVTGRLVPDDIAVMGVDGSDFCRFITPSLTTMEVQKDTVAKATIEMLHEMRTKKSIPEAKVFPTLLIEREST